jgi:hypothetical protein
MQKELNKEKLGRSKAEADMYNAQTDANEQKQIADAAESDKNAAEQEVAKRKTFMGRFMKGGSKKRKYSFKKLPKRKRRNNKSNKTQAKKRGKRLNRSKKMSR